MDILFLALLFFVTDAAAQPARLGIDTATALTYLWIALWGAIGGLVSFYQKVRSGSTRWLNLHELVGELATSSFVGIITGLLCSAADAPAALTYAAVGITGHMGGRAIFWFERAAQRYAEKRIGIEKIEEKKD